jgi:glucose-1-phosphatase
MSADAAARARDAPGPLADPPFPARVRSQGQVAVDQEDPGVAQASIYHLVPTDQWATADDPYRPASLSDAGFVHCSSRNQIPRGVEAIFRGRRDLVMLEIDPDRLAAEVVWEDLYGLGEDFPHVYGPIPHAAVVRATRYPTDAEPGSDEPAMAEVSLAVCDLGGVVIRIDHRRILDAWAARSTLSAEDVHAGFPDPAYHAFERGELDETSYLDHVRRRYSLDASDDELVDDFNRIFVGPDPDTVDVLRDLSADGMTVVALSNTNVIHERAWSTGYADHLEVFSAIHCSHDLGVRKPEPAAYTKVLDRHATQADRALFIDDLPSNVEAARTLGLRGIVFEGASQLAEDLRELTEPSRHHGATGSAPRPWSSA